LKELFEQYAAMRLEHADLKKRISRMQRELKLLKNSQVADTVTGSREDLTIGPIKVVGKPTRQYAEQSKRLTALIERYNKDADTLAQKLEEVETYLDGLEDARLRTILRLRYVDGYTLTDVGMRVGLTKTGVLMIIGRHFEKNIPEDG
jgi:DNA-directed RNA polymerase specialized sigma subunit